MKGKAGRRRERERKGIGGNGRIDRTKQLDKERKTERYRE